MRKYDLAKMLEEVRRDEGTNAAPVKKVLTQEQIRELARARRTATPRKRPRT
jgi:hypothetical protein